MRAAGEDVARSEGAAGNSYILHSVTVFLDLVRLLIRRYAPANDDDESIGLERPRRFFGRKSAPKSGSFQPNTVVCPRPE